MSRRDSSVWLNYTTVALRRSQTISTCSISSLLSHERQTSALVITERRADDPSKRLSGTTHRPSPSIHSKHIFEPEGQPTKDNWRLFISGMRSSTDYTSTRPLDPGSGQGLLYGDGALPAEERSSKRVRVLILSVYETERPRTGSVVAAGQR